MKTRGFLIFLAIFFGVPAWGQTSTAVSKSDMAKMMVTPEVVATYGCSLYAEGQLVPWFLQEARAVRERGQMNREWLKKHLAFYERTASAMCAEVVPIIGRKARPAIEKFSDSVPVPEPVFASREQINQWAADEISLVVEGSRLVQMARIIQEADVAILGDGNKHLDAKTLGEIRSNYGPSISIEREWMFLLLNSDSFPQVSPPGYALEKLRAAELRSRKLASRVQPSRMYWQLDLERRDWPMYFDAEARPIALKHTARFKQ